MGDATMGFNIFHMKQRYSLYIIIVSLLCFSLLGVIIYNNVSDMMIEQSKSNAMGLSVIAANEIDGDIFETIRSEEDEGFSYVYDLIEKYKDYNMLEYIYTMRLEDGVLTFVVDADPEDPAKCGEEYEWLEDMEPAFAVQVCCDKSLTQEKCGKFFSAYAPIFNSNHEVVGIVGCDIMTSDINARLERLSRMIIILISTFAIICLIALILISKDMLHRDHITEIANDDKLKQIAARLNRKNKLKDYSGMLVNIKDFKYINQQIGFNKGDEILKEYAQYLWRLMEQKEYVARTGNDNFLMLVKKGREMDVLKVLSPLELRILSQEGEKALKIYS